MPPLRSTTSSPATSPNLKPQATAKKKATKADNNALASSSSNRASASEHTPLLSPDSARVSKDTSLGPKAVLIRALNGAGLLKSRAPDEESIEASAPAESSTSWTGALGTSAKAATARVTQLASESLDAMSKAAPLMRGANAVVGAINAVRRQGYGTVPQADDGMEAGLHAPELAVNTSRLDPDSGRNRNGTPAEVSFKNGKWTSPNPCIQSLFNFTLATPGTTLGTELSDGYLSYQAHPDIAQVHDRLQKKFTFSTSDLGIEDEKLPETVEEAEALVDAAGKVLETSQQAVRDAEDALEHAQTRAHDFGYAAAVDGITLAATESAAARAKMKVDTQAVNEAVRVMEKVKEGRSAVKMLPSFLLRVLKEGADAVGPKGAGIARELCDLGQGLVIGGDPHFTEPVKKALREASLDTQLKLGAALLLSRERKKELDGTTTAIWGTSVVASAAIGKLTEAFVIDPLKEKVLGKGFNAIKLSNGWRVVESGLEATKALPSEAADATLVGVFKNYLESEPDEFGKKHLEMPSWSDAGEGLMAGLIASGASWPAAAKKYMLSNNPTANKLIGAFCNQVAAFGCGAIVPMSLAKDEQLQNAGTLAAIQAGLTAPVEGKDTKTRRANIHSHTGEIMSIMPGTETYQKALAITSLAAMLPWLAEVYMHASPAVLTLMDRTIFNPIEATAMNSILILAQHLGVADGFITRDERKLEQLFSEVLDKSTKKEAITWKSLKAIFHPRLEKLSTMGRGINAVLSGLSIVPAFALRSVGLMGPSIESRQDYEKAAGGDLQV